MRFFRARRLRGLVEAYPDFASLSVLDVGGRPAVWEQIKATYGLTPARLVILNSDSEVRTMNEYECTIGDGRDIPFADNSFDLVFSNSVIEHIGGLDDMVRFARACERVGRELYIQTPNRWFPIEPHIVTAFIHWLPERIYRKLAFVSLRRLSLRSDGPKFYSILDGIRLLSGSRIRALFPDRTVQTERFFGLTKSFIVADRKVV